MGDSMNAIGGKTPLQITFPGSHDSGAYSLTPKLLPGYSSPLLETIIKVAEKFGLPIEDVVTPWSLAQNCDFYQQMVGGIRYFDLRAGWCPEHECKSMSGANWYTFHFEIGNSVETLVADIKRFLDDFPSEIVIVEVSHITYGDPSSKEELKLASILTEYLGDYMLPPTASLSQTTIRNMTDSGHRAIVTLDSPDNIRKNTNLWSPNTIINSYANTDELSKMVAYNEKQVEYFATNKFPDQFYKISWTLTPQTSNIVEMFLPNKPHSLHNLAEKANGNAFDNFTSSAISQGYSLGNILIIDFFEESNIVETVQSSHPDST
eukprot:TRINITY_DN371_c0_g1_i2.p1 TRINITY_DN371_c0_g1~~TRINITY_DN371_c0_g1_i2.p1  ORF type:complete len:369 (+),score=120.71 TRINITY_DN371_c0_g1_i2:148-1107(+)